MNFNKKYLIIYFLISMLPILYTTLIYSSMPSEIPTHFNFYNIADGYGAKSTIWFGVFVYFIIDMAVLGLLLLQIKKVQKSTQHQKIDNKIILYVNIFITFISIVFVYSSANYNEKEPFNIGAFILIGGLIITITAILDYIRQKKQRVN